ncbi:MAG: hypothetical protein GWN72_19810 [Nitrospinaceae bacterium]|nr:hypothetical protein [Nitrospinaceae bacterium]NIW61051.1 hypothetical protein [Nitrospinaceae bacterium]
MKNKGLNFFRKNPEKKVKSQENPPIRITGGICPEAAGAFSWQTICNKALFFNYLFF